MEHTTKKYPSMEVQACKSIDNAASCLRRIYYLTDSDVAREQINIQLRAMRLFYATHSCPFVLSHYEKNKK